MILLTKLAFDIAEKPCETLRFFVEVKVLYVNIQ